MSGQQEIIKEYLVKLGFTVDKKEQKDFSTSIETVEKGVMKLGKGLLAVAAAGVAMATSFALSMDKLFYASQKANSSASNLKALEYAGRQIGMTAEAVDQMVTSMSMALRMNPGKFGLLEGLGINNAQTRQGVDVFMELMDKLHDKPMYEGAQFAEMLGVSPDQLFQIETNLGDFHQKFQDRLKMAKDAGLDQDAAARSGRELANLAGTAMEKGGITTDLLANKAAPTLIKAGEGLLEAADAIKRAVTGQPLTEKQKAMNADVDHPWWARHKDDKEPATSLLGSQPGWMDRLNESLFGKSKKTDPKAPQAEALFGHIEDTLGLRPGELDHLWKRESNRGDPRFMKSSAGAEGHFGLMPGTSKDMGVKDPYDLNDAAWGAGKYIKQQYDKFKSWELAEQAYNWGPGNMQRYLGAKAEGKNPKMPKETQDYIKPTQNITINVNGAKSPAETASAVKRKIDTAAADQQRYVAGAVR